jgi:hypothetical protein
MRTRGRSLCAWFGAPVVESFSGAGIPTSNFAIVCFGVLGLAMLAGCTGGLKNLQISLTPLPPTPMPVTTDAAVVAKSIYYGDVTNQTVDVYAANQGGSAPVVMQYGISNGPYAVTEDPAGNLYMGQDTGNSGNVLVVPAGKSVVTQTIALPAPTGPAVNQINTMTTDAVGNLYVATALGTIYVYGPGAGSGAIPVRTIAGPLTQLLTGLFGVSEMALDAAGNLYVAEGAGYKGSVVLEFPAGANGNVAPTVVTSAAYLPTGVALDSMGNIYISQSITQQSTTGFATAVYEFAAGSVSGAMPMRTIAGTNTGLGFDLYNIQVDAAGNIFVLEYVGLGGEQILVFGATANGNVAPASTLVIATFSTTTSQFYLR